MLFLVCRTDQKREACRVTINLTSDVFEQVVMAAPYVTLKGNGHTISWYYGVGTKYYSIDPATGLYNKTLAMDRYSSEEGNGSLWGGVFIVRGNNFVAENTTFLNTYNYYLTEAEKTDIAGSNLSVDRLAEAQMYQITSLKRDQMLSILRLIILKFSTVQFFHHRIHLVEMVQQIMDITHISTVVQSVVM